MNELKSEMEREPVDVPLSTSMLDANSQLPITQVQLTMRFEIVTQVICMIVFFALPSVFRFVPLLRLEPFPRGVYLIFVFLTTLMTFGYLYKLIWFVRHASSVQPSTRETIRALTLDLRLTLEVYKTAIVSGSVLLPFAMIAVVMGNGSRADLLYRFFTFDVHASIMVLAVIFYLGIVALIYWVTFMWAERLYGQHVRRLESLSSALD